MAILSNDVVRATRKANRMRARHPYAVSAKYDPRLGRIVVHLNSNAYFAFAPQDAEGLESAGPSELRKIEVTPSGLGIYFPALDVDLYLPALLEGFLGSKKWMAQRLGAAGGRSRSIAKTKASRTNGQLGGRPRKTVSG